MVFGRLIRCYDKARSHDAISCTQLLSDSLTFKYLCGFSIIVQKNEIASCERAFKLWIMAQTNRILQIAWMGLYTIHFVEFNTVQNYSVEPSLSNLSNAKNWWLWCWIQQIGPSYMIQFVEFNTVTNYSVESTLSRRVEFNMSDHVIRPKQNIP